MSPCRNCVFFEDHRCGCIRHANGSNFNVGIAQVPVLPGTPNSQRLTTILRDLSSRQDISRRPYLKSRQRQRRLHWVSPCLTFANSTTIHCLPVSWSSYKRNPHLFLLLQIRTPDRLTTPYRPGRRLVPQHIRTGHLTPPRLLPLIPEPGIGPADGGDHPLLAQAFDHRVPGRHVSRLDDGFDGRVLGRGRGG